LSERELRELFDVMGGLEGSWPDAWHAKTSPMRKFARNRAAALRNVTASTASRHARLLPDQPAYPSEIVEASRNSTLLAAYATSPGGYAGFATPPIFARKRQRWGEAMREHEMILDALRRRAGSELSRHPLSFICATSRPPRSSNLTETDALSPARSGVIRDRPRRNTQF